jgi:hypothetical protein
VVGASEAREADDYKNRYRTRWECIVRRAVAGLSIAAFIAGGTATSAYATEVGETYTAYNSRQIQAGQEATIRVICSPKYRMVVDGSQWVKSPTDLAWQTVTGNLPNDPLKRQYVDFHVKNLSDIYRAVTVGTDCTNRLIP